MCYAPWTGADCSARPSAAKDTAPDDAKACHLWNPTNVVLGESYNKFAGLIITGIIRCLYISYIIGKSKAKLQAMQLDEEMAAMKDDNVVSACTTDPKTPIRVTTSRRSRLIDRRQT